MASGAASAAIALDEGVNTIRVEVTSEDGNATKIYTVVVERLEQYFAISNQTGTERVVEGGLIRLLIEMNPRPTQEVVVPLHVNGEFRSRISLTPSNPAAVHVYRYTPNENVTGDLPLVFTLGTLPDGYGTDEGYRVLPDFDEVTITVIDDDTAALSVTASPNPAQAGQEVTFTGRTDFHEIGQCGAAARRTRMSRRG